MHDMRLQMVTWTVCVCEGIGKSFRSSISSCLSLHCTKYEKRSVEFSVAFRYRWWVAASSPHASACMQASTTHCECVTVLYTHAHAMQYIYI